MIPKSNSIISLSSLFLSHSYVYLLPLCSNYDLSYDVCHVACSSKCYLELTIAPFVLSVVLFFLHCLLSVPYMGWSLHSCHQFYLIALLVLSLTEWCLH